jgi:hypothetical protein
MLLCFDWDILTQALLGYYMELSQCLPLNVMSWRIEERNRKREWADNMHYESAEH